MELSVAHEDVKVALGVVIKCNAHEAKELGAIITRFFTKRRGRRSDAQASLERLGAELNGLKTG